MDTLFLSQFPLYTLILIIYWMFFFILLLLLFLLLLLLKYKLFFFFNIKFDTKSYPINLKKIGYDLVLNFIF